MINSWCEDCDNSSHLLVGKIAADKVVCVFMNNFAGQIPIVECGAYSLVL